MSKSRDLSRFHAGSLDIDAGNINVDGSVTADGLVVDGATDLNGDLDVSGGAIVDGDLLVGTPSAYGADGATISTNGFLFSKRTSNVGLGIDRLATDGALIELKKDGVAVGSVGAVSSQTYIGTALTGLIFHEAPSFVGPKAPSNIAALSDADISLGWTNQRFKDLHLSGGVVFGDAGGSGTSSSNTLDSYETGTWTPVFGNANLHVNDHATYLKIGDTVWLWAEVSPTSAPTTSGAATVSNLPFTAGNQSVYPRGVLTLSNVTWGGSGDFPWCHVPDGSSTVAYYKSRQGISWAAIPFSSFPSDSSSNFSVCYQIN
jgi:hypothetical protein